MDLVKQMDFPEGTILVDVRYVRYPTECFEVVYRSTVTNQLEVSYEEPLIDIWFMKEEYRTNKYQIAQCPIDQCYKIICKPSQIPKLIAENIGGEWKKIYDETHAVMNFYDLKKKMCECPWVFKADFTPDVYYRLNWLNKYGSSCDLSKVSFGLVDIECDVLDNAINAKDITSAPQPINAVSIILPEHKIVALLVLGPRPEHKLNTKFHTLLSKQKVEYDWLVNHQDEFKRKIIEEDGDNKEYLKDYDIRLHLFDFNNEINLIKTVFDYINKYRPMFTMSWNAKFDDNYLMQRISLLGYDPHDIIIPKEFKTKTLYYSEDKSKNFALKTSKDWMFCSSYTTYLCQMRLFAAIRKSQQERRSYSLSSVGKDVAGIDKLSDTKSGTFREFAYTDFLKFLLYNIRDVVVQLAIELKSNDLQSLVSRSLMFATQYSKCFQETHIVRNAREYYYENNPDNPCVQACRLLIEPGIDIAFKGAFVAPPENNAPTGYVLNGKRINNIIYGAFDADAKAFYPSTKAACNLDPMSLHYKCIIDNAIFTSNQCVNRSFNQEYYWHDSKNKPHHEDITGPIMNSYKNGNLCSMMANWFNMPSISEAFDYIDTNINI